MRVSQLSNAVDSRSRDAASDSPSPTARVQLKRELAGLSLSEQLERVRPAPVRSPVQCRTAQAGTVQAADDEGQPDEGQLAGEKLADEALKAYGSGRLSDVQHAVDRSTKEEVLSFVISDDPIRRGDIETVAKYLKSHLQPIAESRQKRCEVRVRVADDGKNAMFDIVFGRGS